MGVFSKKEDFSDYTTKELETMLRKSKARLTELGESNREAGSFVSSVKDFGASGVNMGFPNLSSERKYLQTHINEIERVLGERKAPTKTETAKRISTSKSYRRRDESSRERLMDVKDFGPGMF